jgi:hypothetical protein
MPKATMVMTSASGFFPHNVFSAGVSLIHAYLTFLWTSRFFQFSILLYKNQFSLSGLKSLFPDFSLWFFLHFVFSTGVSLLHAYLTFL